MFTDTQTGTRYIATLSADGTGRVAANRPHRLPHPLASPSQHLGCFCGFIHEREEEGQYRTWGYLGSGPTALAYDILADFIGEPASDADHHHGDTLAYSLRQYFKADIVATKPQNQGWTLHGSEIAAWLSLPAQQRTIEDYIADRTEWGQSAAAGAVLALLVPKAQDPPPDDDNLDVDDIYHRSHPVIDEPTQAQIAANWNRQKKAPPADPAKPGRGGFFPVR